MRPIGSKTGVVPVLCRYEVWVFLHLILLVNAVFVAGIATEWLQFGLYNWGRFLLLAGVLLSVVFLSRGIGGILDTLAPMKNYRANPAWYLFALLIAPASAALFLLGKSLFQGNDIPTIDLNFSLSTRFDIFRVVVIGALIGEVVWISHCFRMLRHTMSFYLAGLIVGLYWGVWWLPIVLFNVGVVPDMNIAGLIIGQAGIGIMCAFLYAKTHSGLLVSILQVMVNSILLVFPVSPAPGIATYTQFTVLYFVFPTLLFLAFGPSLYLSWPSLSVARFRNEPCKTRNAGRGAKLRRRRLANLGGRQSLDLSA